MNRLAPAPDDGGDGEHDADADRYLLPKHAHLVVYERDSVADGDENEDGDGDREDGDGDREKEGGDREDGRGDRQLVTIYDCGAAQKPPSAQLLGELGSVRAACETTRNPTGYVVSMRERAVLVDEGEGHWVVRPR